MFVRILAALAAAQGVACELCFAPPPTFAAVLRGSLPHSALPARSAVAGREPDQPIDRARLEAAYLVPPAIRPSFWADTKSLTDAEILHILERAAVMEASMFKKADPPRQLPPMRNELRKDHRTQRRNERKRTLRRKSERIQKRDASSFSEFAEKSDEF